jgi:hypothetical protein
MVRIQLTRHGPRQLRRLPSVQANLMARANRIARSAGPGMVASAISGKNRARASVITTTWEARRAEAQSMALTRAIDAGR